MMRRLGLALAWVAGLLVLAFCMINVHEIGHTVAAWLAGDHGAYYALYQTYPDGSFNCIGCNHYDPSLLTFWGKLAVAAAGVLATQLVFAAGVLAARHGRRMPGLGPRLAWFVVFVIGDAIYQTIQALGADIAIQRSLTNVDFADVVWLAHTHWHVAIGVLKLLLVALTAIYALVAARAVFARAGGSQRRRAPATA